MLMKQFHSDFWTRNFISLDKKYIGLDTTKPIMQLLAEPLTIVLESCQIINANICLSYFARVVPNDWPLHHAF